MSKLLDFVTPSWIKIGAVAVLGLVVFLGYRHYTGLLEDLEQSQLAIATLTQQRDAAQALAEANAAAVVRVTAQSEATLAELELAHKAKDAIYVQAAAIANELRDLRALPVSKLDKYRELKFGGPR
jgi:hypothetical protein